jgi:hypothetical protein
MVTQPGPPLQWMGAMLPFPLGIAITVYLGSLAIVSWGIVTSKPAPEDDFGQKSHAGFGLAKSCDPKAQNDARDVA